jgi:outer membrane protein TolC
MGVKSAYLNLQTAEKQISTYEKAVEQAEQALKIAETTFELGKSTSSEVTEANINLMNAKKSLSQQIHAYNLALLDYEYSIGIGKGA